MTHSEKNHEPQHGLGLSADEVLTTARTVRKRLDAAPGATVGTDFRPGPRVRGK
jgi:hypothetical protein